jgi:hypothetical protein
MRLPLPFGTPWTPRPVSLFCAGGYRMTSSGADFPVSLAQFMTVR